MISLIGNSTGHIFDIQRFCLHDGPGVRTTVFFKGCSLRCRWCSNPESHNSCAELLFDEYRCINCLNCISECPKNALSSKEDKVSVERSRCTACGHCVKVCPTQALRISGSVMSVQEVVKQAEKDLSFFCESGGGVTISGGEPLFQKEFLQELLFSLKHRNINTAVETSGNVSWSAFKSTYEYADLFLYDIKHHDVTMHRRGTGFDNISILSNLGKLVSLVRKRVILRYTLIPDFNTSQESIEGLCHLIQKFQIEKVELLPYHRLGSGKYRQLGKKYPFIKMVAASELLLQEIKLFIEGKTGVDIVVVA